jgi:hypothetical protein
MRADNIGGRGDQSFVLDGQFQATIL